MMRRPTAPRSALLAIVVLAVAGAGSAEELRSAAGAGLIGTLRFEDAVGRSIETPPASQAVRLVLALADPVTGEPARGIAPAAWIRPVEPGGVACAAAGRAFRATGQLPVGTIDLNGIVLAASFADGAVTLVDPRLDLATANLRAAHRFDATPSFVAGLGPAQAFLLGFPEAGRLVRLDAADGSTRDVAGVGRPTAALAAGPNRVLVADAQDGSVVLAELDGSLPATRWPVGHDPQLAAGVGADALAWSPGGRALLLDGTAGAPALALVRPRLDGAAVVPAAPDPFETPRPAGVALLAGEAIEVVWLDAPDAPTTITLGAPADRLLAAADGRFLFALDRAAGLVAVIDLAAGAVAAVEPIGRPIAETALTDNALFLLADDGASVVVLSLRALRSGTGPRRREVTIGPAERVAADATGALVSLDPAPQVLALNRAAQSAAVVSDYDAMGDAPPMTAVALRGGLPVAIGVVDRTIRETVPGSFEATVAVPPGAWELVASAGVADRTLCIAFAVPGDTGTATRPRVAARLVDPADGALAAGPATVTLALAPLTDAVAPITIVDLATGWRQSLVARRRDDGLYELRLDLPRPGTYGLAPRIRALAQADNMIIEVHP